MNVPKVSVIIPTYYGADFLGEAIQSVLNQTWRDFELIVVNDASPDCTDDVLGRFNDPRIRYLHHETNRGVANARKTGVMASKGEIIAHLDQDDLFHPDKLRIHVEFMDKNPEIGFTYNSRFELFPTSFTVREISRPSPLLSLADFVIWNPLPPSVWVQRRKWAVLDEIWEEKTFYRGREIVICGRLYMAGCKFAMIDRVLNYRRYHKNRLVRNIARQCEAERTCQQIIFDDPRCPRDLRDMKDIAFSGMYSMWGYVAYIQGEYETGRELLQEAIKLNPALLDGDPPPLVHELIIDSVDDEGETLEDVQRRVFENLPAGLSRLLSYHSWAVTRGYLMQGVRALMWNHPVDAEKYFSHVTGLEAQIDESLKQWMISHLLAYQSEYGTKASLRVLQGISSIFERLGLKNPYHKLKGAFFVARAFDRYQSHRDWDVRLSVLRAVLEDPSFLRNKGVLSIYLHSLPLLRRMLS